jgi:hypothetical protein
LLSDLVVVVEVLVVVVEQPWQFQNFIRTSKPQPSTQRLACFYMRHRGFGDQPSRISPVLAWHVWHL